MKRSDVYIIRNDGSGKKAVKVKGYMFEKKGHRFTVRHRDPDEAAYYKKWIISDFVTGMCMTDIDKLIEFYNDIQLAYTNVNQHMMNLRNTRR